MQKPLTKHIILALATILFKTDTSFMPIRPRSFSVLPYTASHLSDNPHLIPQDFLQKINASTSSSLPVARIPLREQTPHVTPSCPNMPCIEPCQVMIDTNRSRRTRHSRRTNHSKNTHATPQLDCVASPRVPSSSSCQAPAVLQDDCLTMPCTQETIVAEPKKLDPRFATLQSLRDACFEYVSIFSGQPPTLRGVNCISKSTTPAVVFALHPDKAKQIKLVINKIFNMQTLMKQRTMLSICNNDANVALVQQTKGDICKHYLDSQYYCERLPMVVVALAQIVSVLDGGTDIVLDTAWGNDETATSIIACFLEVCFELQKRFSLRALARVRYPEALARAIFEHSTLRQAKQQESLL